MRIVEIIEKKKKGQELNTEEIKFFVQRYAAGLIPDYQAAALLMAIYFKGMTIRETVTLTLAMAQSGEQVNIDIPGKVVVDKHSSGGVGDKTTLIVAPLVAACGVPVAKMSGRGLGHTGGTIDKLEAIPGFRAELSLDDFIELVKKSGLSIIAQTENLVPADKKLYALRDVTATVDSLPLIASSIMSKKIASGAQGIVLDVKYGSGAFMKTVDKAKELAQTMVQIGKHVRRETIAILSSMDQPLGRAVGNSLEVMEAVKCLQGKGPADLMEVCLELSSWMLVVGQKAPTLESAQKMLQKALVSGQAEAKFLEFLEAQGADPGAVNDLPLAPVKVEYKAEKEGFIHSIEALKIGLCAMLIGGGRENKDSEIDYGAGLYLLKKQGEYVRVGEPIILLYTSLPVKIAAAREILDEAVIIGREQVPTSKPIGAVIN
ncbi:MAG: pyrimidine-nucleoside phosphorylase [Desulfitobacteriia bacterium]|jgi:pyrimidine-nucleoside phosphorylase